MESTEQHEREVQYLRAIFDTIPHPAFIVDGDMRILDFNTAAEDFMGPEPASALYRRGGEALHCVNAGFNDCGESPACQDCVIRNSVKRALAGGSTCRALHHAQLRTRHGTAPMELLVTASLLPYTAQPRVLLILEDVSQILALCGPNRQKRTTTARHLAPSFQNQTFNPPVTQGRPRPPC
jgi:PAS domain-containing protein